MAKKKYIPQQKSSVGTLSISKDGGLEVSGAVAVVVAIPVGIGILIITVWFLKKYVAKYLPKLKRRKRKR